MIVAKKIIRAFVLILLAASYCAAADDDFLLAQYSLREDSMEQWRLPERLNEISGLAVMANDRLFAVADEEAVIYELDVNKGRLVKAFALGDPVLRGDFEGIAIIGKRFYLVTSDGDIVSSGEGADGEQLRYDELSTGLGKQCEIEGLAADARRNRLIIACKSWRRGKKSRAPSVYTWSVTDNKLLEDETITLPLHDILPAIDANRLNVSGIMVDAETGNLLLVAARQHALLEITAAGELQRALRLPLARRHRQPEGIERLQDGRLLIADEGGNHKARLTVYRADRLSVK